MIHYTVLKGFIAIIYKILRRKQIYAYLSQIVENKIYALFSPGEFLYKKVCYLESLCLFRPWVTKNDNAISFARSAAIPISALEISRIAAQYRIYLAVRY